MSRRPLDLSEHLPYLINRVGSALVARFSADGLAGARLSIASWRVLAALSSNGGLRQTDLAELTSIDASTLVAADHPAGARRPGPAHPLEEDSREVTVAPHAQARKTAMRKLIPIAVALQRQATRRLSKRDLATLKRVLRQMHDNLTTRGISAAPP